jgi:hypothetical protein
MWRRILSLVPDPLHEALRNPSFRYSSHFSKLQDLFAYSPTESMIKTAMQFVFMSQLEGDYLEFGVFEGKSFIAAYHLAQTACLEAMRFYAFDSFAGLPPVRGVDAAGFRHFTDGEFACDEATFRNALAAGGVDLDKVTVVPGFFEHSLGTETKRRLPLRKAAAIYIDCDLYESTLPVLDFLTDYVQEGTILMFDDWYCFRGNPGRGEQRAFREWLARNPSIRAVEYHRFGWQGNSFILQVEAR